MFHFALNQKYTNLNKNRGINIFYGNRVSIPVWFLLLVFYNLHSVQKKLGDFGGKYFKYGRRCGHQVVVFINCYHITCLGIRVDDFSSIHGFGIAR